MEKIKIKYNKYEGEAHYDTEAEVTCLPQDWITISPVDTVEIKTVIGTRKVPLYYDEIIIDGKKVTTEFIGTDTYPILSPKDIPWIRIHKDKIQLTVKLNVHEFQEKLTKESNLTVRGKTKLRRLFDQYKFAWQQWENQVGFRNIQPHHIATGTTPPKPQKQYPINRKARPSIQVVIDDLVAQNVLLKQASPMNTPVYPVPKPNGQWRLVLDYRAVNKVTPPVTAQNTHSTGLLQTIPRKRFKTTLDLSNGFWSHPITLESYWITAFTWLGDQYVWTRLPQGFLNSPALFTADVVTLLQHMDNVVVYVDDIYITSDTEDEHLRDIETVVKILSEAGYIISLKKSEIAKESVVFLGFQISNEGRGLTEDYKNKILQITYPKNLKQLQSILGLLNYARNFIPTFTEEIKPLYHLITTATGDKIQWTPEHSLILKNIIDKLNESSYLEERNPDTRLILKVTASNSAGYIRYYNEGSLKPILYVNHVFSNTEMKFKNIEKLLTVIHKGIMKAIDLAQGKDIVVMSPIHSLTRLQKTPLPDRKALSIRWNAWLSHTEDPRISFQYDPTLPDLNMLPEVSGAIPEKLLTEYEYVYYTDGSAISSPKSNKVHQAAFAVIQTKYQPQMTVIKQWKFPLGDHTAQYAEISAFEFACKQATRYHGDILIVTDSFYVARAFNEELDIWHSNGYLNNKKKPLKHVGKWKMIYQCKQSKPNIYCLHETAHQKEGTTLHTEGNALADRLATSTAYTINVTKVLPDLDSELNQLLSPGKEKPKGYPKNWPYELIEGKVYISFPTGKRQIPSVTTRESLILTAHNNQAAIHIGRQATLAALRSKYWWPYMEKQVKEVLSKCEACIQVNAKVSAAETPMVIKRPEKPFEKFYIDYIGPLPPSQGYSYVLVIVDAATRFTWLYPTKGPTASATVKSLTDLSSIAIPKIIHSDQGSAFTSHELATWAKQFDVILEFSTPYHPQSSGVVERKNREIKMALTKLLVGRPRKWYPLLPRIQLAINNYKPPATGKSASFLLFGTESNIPFAASTDLSREEELSLLQEIRSSLQDPEYKPRNKRFWVPAVGDLVQERVAKPLGLRPRWKPPVKVIEVLNNRTVKVQLPAGEERILSVDNLKKTPHHGSSPVVAENPSSSQKSDEYSPTTMVVNVEPDTDSP